MFLVQDTPTGRLLQKYTFLSFYFKDKRFSNSTFFCFNISTHILLIFLTVLRRRINFCVRWLLFVVFTLWVFDYLQLHSQLRYVILLRNKGNSKYFSVILIQGMAVRNQNNKDFSLYMNMNALNWDWLSTSTQPGRAAIIYAEDQKFYTTVATAKCAITHPNGIFCIPFTNWSFLTF